MAHHCQAVLITCEDFRLHQKKDGRDYVSEFVKTLGVDCDMITRGGAIQDLVRPKNDGFADSVWRDIEVSVKLHGVKKIYLINHTNCGAYGHFNFTDADKEITQHTEDLKTAKAAILKKYPDLEVRKYIFELKSGTVDEYRINFIE